MWRSESADGSWILDLYPLSGVLGHPAGSGSLHPVHCTALMDCSSFLIVNSSASCTEFDLDSRGLQHEAACFVCTTLEDSRMPGSVLLPEKFASVAGAFSSVPAGWFPPGKLVCCRGENSPVFAGISQWHSYLNAWKQRYSPGDVCSMEDINASLDRLVRFRNRKRLSALRRQEHGGMQNENEHRSEQTRTRG